MSKGIKNFLMISAILVFTGLLGVIGGTLLLIFVIVSGNAGWFIFCGALIVIFSVAIFATLITYKLRDVEVEAPDMKPDVLNINCESFNELMSLVKSKYDEFTCGKVNTKDFDKFYIFFKNKPFEKNIVILAYTPEYDLKKKKKFKALVNTYLYNNLDEMPDKFHINANIIMCTDAASKDFLEDMNSSIVEYSNCRYVYSGLALKEQKLYMRKYYTGVKQSVYTSLKKDLLGVFKGAK